MNKSLIGIVVFITALTGLFTVAYFTQTPVEQNLGVVPCKDDTSKKIDERIQTCPVPANERASFKAREIKKVGSVAKTQRSKYEIEVVSINETKDGIEVYARAWDENGQIGFGDGTVDIERFVIINPPVLVPDATGTIIREWVDDVTGETKQSKFREDTKEALLQVLEQTIDLKKEKFGSENIIAGKRGSTTFTLYPNAGSGTAPVDAETFRAVTTETFSTIRSGAGTNADNTATTFVAGLRARTTTDEYKEMDRGIAGFDTSPIASVTSATLSMWFTVKATDLGDTDVDVVSATVADESSIAASDYNLANHGSTRYITGIAISGITTGAYTDATLNASGEAYINLTGNTFFSFRTKWDVDNSFTGTWASDQLTLARISSADETGTTQDVKLTVEGTGDATSTCTPPASGIWEVDLADACYITSYVQFNGTLNCFGTGRFTVASGGEVVVQKLNCNKSTVIGTGKIRIIN